MVAVSVILFISCLLSLLGAFAAAALVSGFLIDDVLVLRLEALDAGTLAFPARRIPTRLMPRREGIISSIPACALCFLLLWRAGARGEILKTKQKQK